jgi:alpha-L-arabinofuranosidase
VFVNVLNRSKTKDIAARIENQEGTLKKSGRVWELNYTDLKATHKFGDDKKVVPVVRDFSPALEKNGFTHVFPAHSLTILTLALE